MTTESKDNIDYNESSKKSPVPPAMATLSTGNNSINFSHVEVFVNLILLITFPS